MFGIKITELLELEETKDDPFLIHGQEYLLLDHVAQRIQPGLELFQGWGSYSFFGQHVILTFLFS